MIKKGIFLLAIFLFSYMYSVKAQNVEIKSQMIGKDTANTDYLKGEARRLRENCVTLQTKAQEQVNIYKGYVEKTKECKGALEEAKLALDMAQKALKKGEEGIKLADQAEKAKKMKDAKKSLYQIQPKIISGHEYLKESEDRKKEIEFEMKGC